MTVTVRRSRSCGSRWSGRPRSRRSAWKASSDQSNGFDLSGERIPGPEGVQEEDDERSEVDRRPSRTAAPAGAGGAARLGGHTATPRSAVPGWAPRAAMRPVRQRSWRGTVLPGGGAAGEPTVSQLCRGQGSAAAELRPGLDPVVLVSHDRGRVRHRRSPPGRCSSTRPCRSRPRRSRASARSDRARSSRRSHRPAGWSAPRRTRRWPGVGLGRRHVVHPLVHAVRMGGLAGDHPGVRPAGRTLVRQDRLHRLVPRPAGGSP